MQKISVDTAPISVPLSQVEVGETFNVAGTTEYYTRVSDEGLGMWGTLRSLPCLFLMDHDEGSMPYKLVGLDADTQVIVHKDTRLSIK